MQTAQDLGRARIEMAENQEAIVGVLDTNQVFDSPFDYPEERHFSKKRENIRVDAGVKMLRRF